MVFARGKTNHKERNLGEKMNRRFRSMGFFIILIVVGLGGILSGALSSNAVLAVAKERYTELQTFSKVLNLVQQYYVENVDTQKLIKGAIKGMLQELDPHTNYMNSELFKEFQNETSGEFGGLGIEISIQDEILTVISPIEDTPAYEAGVKAGDKIVSVDGKSTKGLSLVEAAHLIKGKKGTKIVLGIYREGFEEPKDYTIVRGTVKIRSVKYTDLGDGYAYFRLTSFIENTTRDLERKLKKHMEKKPGVKGIILDLRNNPGGLLQQARDVSDLFIEEGMIVSTIGRNKKDKEVLYAKKEGTYKDFPIVVLINEYSASASEILAGALKDNQRALIMGQRSFGKGSVQSVVKLGDGSGLKLTVARYYSPSGQSIQAFGITPDIVVENVDPEAFEKSIIKRKVKRESDIAGHLKGDHEKENKPATELDLTWYKNIKEKDPEKLSPRDKLLRQDFQALQAYNYLKAYKVFQN